MDSKIKLNISTAGIKSERIQKVFETAFTNLFTEFENLTSVSCVVSVGRWQGRELPELDALSFYCGESLVPTDSPLHLDMVNTLIQADSSDIAKVLTVCGLVDGLMVTANRTSREKLLESAANSTKTFPKDYKQVIEDFSKKFHTYFTDVFAAFPDLESFSFTIEQDYDYNVVNRYMIVYGGLLTVD